MATCTERAADTMEIPHKALRLGSVPDLECSKLPPTAPRTRNSFTVTYTSQQAPLYADDRDPHAMRQLRERQEIKAQQQQEHEKFIARQEIAARMTEGDKRVAAKMLVQMAAERSLRDATNSGYAVQVVQFMQDTWKTFITQTNNFLSETNGTGLADASVSVSRASIEIISSIGIWFTGCTISLPLRQYAVQVAAPNGGVQTVIVVGLLSFAYSSYVMQLRAAAQQSTLTELMRSQELLGTTCLFIPRLLVDPSVAS